MVGIGYSTSFYVKDRFISRSHRITCWLLTNIWCPSFIICIVCVIPKAQCSGLNIFLSSIDATIIISSQISGFPSAPVVVVPGASIAPPPVTVLISPPRSNPGKVVIIRRSPRKGIQEPIGLRVVDGNKITSIHIQTDSSSLSPGELLIEISVALSSVGEICPPIRTY